MIYDIAVIGAGPAGSTFARLIDSKKYSVAVIDGETEKNKKPCGGLLAPDAQKALAHFNLTLPKKILVDPQIFSVKTIDVSNGKINYYPRHYLNIDRYLFDVWMKSLIPESVRKYTGKCIDINKNNNIFDLTLVENEVRSVIKAKTIIGADGASSYVRRKFFKKNVKYYVAIQQWFESGDSSPFYSCIFDRKTSESCSWSINKDNYFIYGGCFSPKNCRIEFEQQKERMKNFDGFNFGTPLKTEACMALSPRNPRDFITGKDRVFLAGEAAGFISASSFEGISSAIISGSLLAESFNKCKNSKQIQKYYHKKTKKLRVKLSMKVLKRWFMYTPSVRKVIMKSGISSIDIIEKNEPTDF